ncbi:MAG: hypothetical protein Q9184_005470 [Pyrenodesmia sp. 2 TL-2023]
MAKGAEVLAAGFNAHGQLDPSTKPSNISSFKQISYVKDYDPNHEWTKHAVPAALWSSTLLYDNGNLIHLGTSSGYPQNESKLQMAPSVAKFFGDVSGIKGFVSQAGDVFRFMPHPSRQDDPFRREPINTENLPTPKNIKASRIAIAGNGKVCIAVQAFEDCDCGSNDHASKDGFNNIAPGFVLRQLCDPWSCEDGSCVHLDNGSRDPPARPQPIEDDVFVYPELNCLFVGCCIQNIHRFKGRPEFPGVVDLAATATSFNALTGDHKVKTMGDPRYPDLLGRTPANAKEAASFKIVSALEGIPIRKIVAGSWMVAALSKENDLYVWGHALPQSPAKKDHAGLSKLLNAVNENGEREDVHLVDIADGADIQDVAVGDEHIVVLTKDGLVWGLGSNEYGQLGLGEEVKGTAGEWALLRAAGRGAKCVEVKAGPLTAFLVVMNEDKVKNEDVVMKEEL